MKIGNVEIVDVGRGPQIAGHRLTVMDVFYYLRRGFDFEFIRQALPSLTREEFDAVADYVRAHHAELVERDHRAEDFIRRGIVDQKAKGLYPTIDESVPQSERIEQLKVEARRRKAENGRGDPPR